MYTLVRTQVRLGLAGCNGIMLKNFMKATWLVPNNVPSAQQTFIDSQQYNKAKWVLKYIKRLIFCKIFIQHFGLTPQVLKITQSHLNILWINMSAPSIGDSLMDLSCRVLLENKSVTLFTHKKNVELYLNDHFFSSVYSDVRELKKKTKGNGFDLVICDAFSPRVLFYKLAIAPTTSFAGLYGYVNGFEVHRTYFAFARMRELTGQESFDYPVRPTISHAEQHELEYDVCIALGGSGSSVHIIGGLRS